MKLMLANADQRILNWGAPPWANQDTLIDYAIIDIGNQEVPFDLRNYRYVNATFVYDPLPPTQQELDRQAMIAAEVTTMLTQIDTRRTQIVSDITALAAAGTLAAVKPIVQRQLNAEDIEMLQLSKVLKFLRWLAG
jgi:hypothetical protein